MEEGRDERRDQARGDRHRRLHRPLRQARGERRAEEGGGGVDLLLSLPPRSGGEGRPERSEGRGGGSLIASSQRRYPHPGLRFASAFPPHRFAGGGINPVQPPLYSSPT